MSIISNGIQTRQNEEKSLHLLAAQRQLYNEAKLLVALSFFLSVVLPLLSATFGIHYPKPGIIYQFIHISPIVYLLISNAITKTVESKMKTASRIQALFDSYVFQMQSMQEIESSLAILADSISRKSRKIFKNIELKNQLINWYRPEVDKIPIENAILLCQSENIKWDSALRLRLRIIYLILCGLLTIVIIGIGFINNETLLEVFCRILFLIPLAVWFLSAVTKLREDAGFLKELNMILDTCIKNMGKSNMQEISLLSEKIMNHRAQCYIIPNFFYRIFKDTDEMIASVAISIVEN